MTLSSENVVVGNIDVKRLRTMSLMINTTSVVKNRRLDLQVVQKVIPAEEISCLCFPPGNGVIALCASEMKETLLVGG